MPESVINDAEENLKHFFEMLTPENHWPFAHPGALSATATISGAVASNHADAYCI